MIFPFLTWPSLQRQPEALNSVMILTGKPVPFKCKTVDDAHDGKLSPRAVFGPEGILLIPFKPNIPMLGPDNPVSIFTLFAPITSSNTLLKTALASASDSVETKLACV